MYNVEVVSLDTPKMSRIQNLSISEYIEYISIKFIFLNSVIDTKDRLP